MAKSYFVCASKQGKTVSYLKSGRKFTTGVEGGKRGEHCFVVKCLNRFPIPKLLKSSKSLISDRESVKAMFTSLTCQSTSLTRPLRPKYTVHEEKNKKIIFIILQNKKRKTRKKEKRDLNITK